ncbi:hypothetical protein EGW08_020106 [Elysia chlorotica]|uniref:H-type lectin domain-containing protein n=1 Tax=Elysia chlorotica TaxID=188477 RepID=A0A3S1AZC3_ELYCH|nr:hypothetical protein EGW08_020106 [Elysia chlorotica]
MAGLIALFLVCSIACVNVGKAQRESTSDDIAADIEMAIVAEQIALNAITSLIEKNKEEIASLRQEIALNPPHSKEIHSETDVVKCVKSNDFDEADAEGNRLRRVKVSFKKDYAAAPNVLASIQRLDIPKEADHKFEIRVENVTTKDFTLICIARGNETVIDQAVVSYLSVPKK